MDDFDELMDDELLEQNEEINSENNELIELNPTSLEPSQSQDISVDPVIVELLKALGILDTTKIKFEEDGQIEEIDWNSLDILDKLNILNSSKDDNVLEEDELQLINNIRLSQLTVSEYINFLQQNSVLNYIQNAQNQQTYTVDDYSDEELYVMDLLGKSPDITEEEARELLELAKSNEGLFKKQITSLRNSYKLAEEESIQYLRLLQQQEQLESFNDFASNIAESIRNFTEFSGYELNMDSEDMQNLYDFITGTDTAGNSWFGKALNDPESVTLMAWFILYGKLMILDISEYYQKEITSVREKSYKKGLEDSIKNPTQNVIYKPKDKKGIRQEVDDLDNF